MNKLLKVTPKNTYFSTKIWWPTRIAFPQPDGTFAIRVLGFGERVMCQVKHNLKSPLPTLEYVDYQEYANQWRESVEAIAINVLNLDDEDARGISKQLLNKYGVDTPYREAVLNHFENHLESDDLKGY